MYIELENLICYIDSYSPAFFDQNTYKLYFENELPDNANRSELLKLPQIDERTIVQNFVEKHLALSHMPMGNVKRMSLNKFHNEINKYGIYDEWIDFRTNYLIDIASEWCHSYNINVSKK